MKRTRGAIGYNYAPTVRYIEPFKNLIKSKSKWLTFIKDFNFNYKPSQISIKADVFRQFGATRPKNVGGGPYKIPETYDKYFTFDRFYIVRWDFTRSLSLDYSAINYARIDEPFGRIDTKEEKDSIKENFFKGGRNTHFHQEATFTYNFPTNKFPILDWTTLRASYRAEYDWYGASLLAKRLGNILSNGQTKSVNAELGFDRLYDKWKFLRRVYAPPVPNQQTHRR
jgi:cell surface protein SprA